MGEDLFSGCSGRTLNGSLRWLNEPASWVFRDGELEILPHPKTDFFRPFGGPPGDNACLLHASVRGDFTATAHVSAVLAGFGDAGALTVRADAMRWMKICVERSPIGEISIVSVVTDPTSDDSNGELLREARAELRITRKGNAFAMHYRASTGAWRFVRAFGFELPETVLVGVHAQAPFQGGCSARIRAFHLSHVAVADFRSGE
jgi:hypothetical protein